MQRLNLPECALRLRRESDGGVSVYDPLRRKYVALTPEEWVRQHFVGYLINDRHFPQGYINNEISLVQNGIKRRCDTLVTNRTGHPLMIVEYKASSVAITQKVFDQIVRYNSVLHASYLVVSNGIVHICCKLNYADNSYEFLSEIPDFRSLID